MTIIDETKAWLQKVVIDLQLCPFAKQPFNEDRIHYIVSDHRDKEQCLQSLIAAMRKMDNSPNIETCLIILAVDNLYDAPNSTLPFLDYLDLLELANTLTEELNYEGIYQLASFHPDYQFDGVEKNDVTNYSNRSPYPMFHIIRETDLEDKLTNFPHAEDIPDRNIETMKKIGISKMKKILTSISEDPS